ncbi:NADPH-dependent 1-acyldihydroxyacetone phosphate reductase [Spathaspora sp. JA1]|nr:NADPH-dependent 1-acyldihydroxyacetone phosphate reductase [Spathaspora sp. JA1]
MSTKYALVTGACQGIGYSLSVELSKAGYTVIGCSPKKVIHLQKPLEEKYGLISIPLDITDVEQIKAVVPEVHEITGGKLHVLYNNAGISVIGPAIETSEEDLFNVFNVNVFGHINMTKYFAPQVINAKGTILFTSSIAGRAPLSWVSAYNSSKAAIDQYALTLHGEMKPFGVRVHSVITGGVNTAICDPNLKIKLVDSYYDVPGVQESLKASATMSRDVNISPDKYAQEIVADIQSRFDPGFNLYHGARAYLMHWASRFLPFWFFEIAVQIHFKQYRVFQTIAKKVKEGIYTKKNL